MKMFMRIMAILILFLTIILTIITIFDVGTDFNEFAQKIASIYLYNGMSLIALAACSYCLERNDNNYFVRIIPIYVSIPIILITILVFFNVIDEWFLKMSLFFIYTSTALSFVSIAMIVRPNNVISSFIRIISFIAILVCAIISVINIFDQNSYSTMMSSSSFISPSLNLIFVISNAFSYFKDFSDAKSMVYCVSAIIQYFSIILLFITNYAFGSSIQLEDGDIDYEAVKKDALNAANLQMQQRYNINQFQTQQPINNITQNNQNGLMNINNQLGSNSNVGNVNEVAKETNVEQNSLDAIIPLSNGPVVNNSISQQQDNTQANINPTPNQNIENQVQNNNVNNTPVQQQNIENQIQNNNSPVQQQNVDNISNPFLNQ